MVVTIKPLLALISWRARDQPGDQGIARRGGRVASDFWQKPKLNPTLSYTRLISIPIDSAKMECQFHCFYDPKRLEVRRFRFRISSSRPFSFPCKPHFHLFVNADRIEHFRKRLQDLAEEISNDLAANKDDAGIVELDTSIGRLSRMDAMQNQQMALELRRRRENQLLRIKNAFKRMDKGQYGKCGKCGKPIDEARLEVFPDVVTCVACA